MRSGERFQRQRGATLVIAIFILVFISLLGMVALSLFSTREQISGQEANSTQSLFIAEGGIERGRRELALDANWYFNAYPDTLTRNLGPGQFLVEFAYPATALRRNIGAASPSGEIRVFAVGNFPSSGALYVDGEIITYTGTAVDLPNGPRFTGVTRGSWGTGASPHGIGTRVYPATQLTAAVGPGAGRTLDVVTTATFLWRGSLTLDPGGANEEDAAYGDLTANTFTGVDLTVGHGAGEIVTPLLSSDQAGITATGTVNQSRRQVRCIMER